MRTAVSDARSAIHQSIVDVTTIARGVPDQYLYVAGMVFGFGRAHDVSGDVVQPLRAERRNDPANRP